MKISLIISLVPFATFAAGPNLLVNPSFEDPHKADFPNYVDLAGGSTYLTGWTTLHDGAELFTTIDIGLAFTWPTTIADGLQAVDLPPRTRTGGGGIEQAFSTTPGETYHVSFELGTALAHGRDGNGTVDVTVDGVNHHYDLTTQSSDWDWKSFAFTFVANDAAATLAFESFDDPTLHFASVDNVSVIPPEKSNHVPDRSSTGCLLLTGLAVAACLGKRLRIQT